MAGKRGERTKDPGLIYDKDGNVTGCHLPDPQLPDKEGT